MRPLKKHTPLWAKVSTRIRPLKFTIQTTALFLFFSFSSVGQDLSAFKYCSTQKGANAVPYSSLKSKVQSQTRYVTSGKTGTKGLSPSMLKSQQKNILEDLEDLNDDLRTAQKNHKDWIDDNPGTNNPYDRDISDAEKAITAQEKKVKAIYAKIDKGIDAYQDLYEARVKMRKIFEEIWEELDDSEDRPGDHLPSGYTDDDEDDLKGYITKIKAHIKQQAGTHEDEEDSAKDRVAELKALI